MPDSGWKPAGELHQGIVSWFVQYLILLLSECYRNNDQILEVRLDKPRPIAPTPLSTSPASDTGVPDLTLSCLTGFYSMTLVLMEVAVSQTTKNAMEKVSFKTPVAVNTRANPPSAD